MQWTHLTRRGQPFGRGRGASTSAGLPSFTNWRWPAVPFGGLPIPSCLLEEAWADPKTSHPRETGWAPDAGPGSAGGPTPRRVGVDSERG